MKFLNYVHNFRGVAILYIVSVHCISAFNWEHINHMETFLRIFLGYGSVLFVFIAGYLFQHLSERYEFKKYMLKKLWYVGLPYLICSIPAIIFFIFFQERWDAPAGLYEHSELYQAAAFYLTGTHLAPFWFIPMIFIYFAISPFLIWIDRHPKIYYLLPVFIGISLVVKRGFVLENFIHFFSVYTGGMFCSHYRAWIMEKISRNATILMLFVVIAMLSVWDFYSVGHQAIYLQKLALCVFCLALLYRFDDRLNTVFSVFASTSFGIYFIHSYIISAVKLLYSNRTGDYFRGSIPGFVLFTLLMIAVSTGAILCLQRILGRKSRYVIGC